MKLILTYLCFLSVIGSTPYYEFMERVSYYKNRSLESSGCGLWQDVLRLHLRHENYCEDAIMGKLSEFDDFEMAAISWIVSKEWDNPLLSDDVRVRYLISQTGFQFKKCNSRMEFLVDWLMFHGGLMKKDPFSKEKMDTWNIGVKTIRLVGFQDNIF